MKFIKADAESFRFEIEQRERRMLFRMLELYPLIPVAHQQLSKNEHRSEDQLLLEEALTDVRLKNKAEAEALLKSKTHFRETEHGYRFSLKNEQMEWLLQVLNDVRVGSWLILGSPDGPTETLAVLNPATAPYFWAMEVAGQFQMVLINAMKRRS